MISKIRTIAVYGLHSVDDVVVITVRISASAMEFALNKIVDYIIREEEIDESVDA